MVEKNCFIKTIMLKLELILMIIYLWTNQWNFQHWQELSDASSREWKIVSTNSFRRVLVWVIKMLQYDRIDVPEGIDINKANESKECLRCHYWYFKDVGYKFELFVCNGCHAMSIMADEL